MAWIPDWSAQISAIALAQPIDTILRVGICDENALVAAQARRVVLVEPDPDRAAALARRTADLEHVDVIAAALGERSGEAPFLRLSLPEFSGMDMPEDLMTLYPGLRIEARLDTAVLDVPALLQKARIEAPEAGFTHLLILDSPVAAARHAALFLDASAQETFDRILLQTSREGMAGPPADALLRRFTDAGFLTEDTAHPDPDFVRTRLAYPARLREADAAAAGMDALQKRLEDLRQQNTALSQAEDSMRQDLRLALRMQAMLERDIAELRTRFSALREAKDAQDALLARTMSLLARALEAIRKTPPSKPKKS